MGMDVLLLTHAQFNIAIIPGVGQELPLDRLRQMLEGGRKMLGGKKQYDM